jgi:hypothetical protein
MPFFLLRRMGILYDSACTFHGRKLGFRKVFSVFYDEKDFTGL